MSSISRRTALKTLTGTALAASLPGVVRGAESPSAALTMKGNLRHSVCRWCYNSIPLDEFCRAVKAMGLESVELLGPDEWPIALKHGLTCAMASGPTTIPEGVNHLDNHATMIPAFRERIVAAAKAGFPNVIVFSGNRRGMSDEQGLDNCETFIKQVVGHAEKAGITVCMELLNSKVNHIDYQCDHTAWGVELVKRVGSERFKLLYDIYHMQIMEGDVIRNIRDNQEYIAHYHTAGNPGRHEFTSPDDVQELDYVGIMKAIRDTGFKGFVAQEFIPTRDPLTSLRESVIMCDV